MNAPQLPDVTLIRAAEICKVHEQTIRKWARSGKLQAVKIGGRIYTTLEWIQDMARPIVRASDITPAQQRRHETAEEKARIERHNQAKRLLRVRFNVGKKPSRS